ncbi:TetR/AcrR family transcriptional regulator [Pyxidicoccus fallax]|uniref:TetR/AcrR family transcriptional regulator n=1 Tax=Pyxidicoccus fallax TaxID=394095 RepID=A0A848LF48_9BACT|nr:TetR/AcrR family transcriptional regulator [Pyxidicoccus fallax]NMO16912.1 TetR/AcrR family transcriptional regulator [Pyxidicoccus fallax]NPC80419.1 TetR/AcrR family transcriptional regulator [Pyxidicoccus fallax]
MAPRAEDQNRQMRERSSEAIRRAALELFIEKGFHAASIAEIAKRAGVSKGLIYNYYRSKDELLQALMEDRLREAAATYASVPAGGGAAEKLRYIVDSSVEQIVRNHELYRLYFALLLQPGATPALQRAEETLAPEFSRIFGQLIALFTESGSDAPETDAVVFQSALNGLALGLLTKARPGEFPTDAIKQRLLRRFGFQKKEAP